MLQAVPVSVSPNITPDTHLLNFGNPDKDLADEFKTLEEELLTLPDGTKVRHNDREPFYGVLTRHEDTYLAEPIGSLTIHLIHAKKLDTHIIHRLFPTSDILDFYIRIDFLAKQFYSKLCVDISVIETRIVFDHLITFTLDNIAINDGAEYQLVIFNLIALEETDPHRHIIIGRAEKPLLSFIKNMVASEILPLSRPAKINELDGGYEGQRSMGTLLVKSAFAYGRFGYGYSNQMFDERMEPCDAIKHSLFPRFAPPLGRTQEAGKVLRFRPIRPLLGELSAHLGNPLLRIDTTEESEEERAIGMAIPWTNPALQLLPVLVKEKMEEWTGKLKLKGCTDKRVEYLREICTANPTMELGHLPA